MHSRWKTLCRKTLKRGIGTFSGTFSDDLARLALAHVGHVGRGLLVPIEHVQMIFFFAESNMPMEFEFEAEENNNDDK